MTMPNTDNREPNNEKSELTIAELDAVSGGGKELQILQETLSHILNLTHESTKAVVQNLRA